MRYLLPILFVCVPLRASDSCLESQGINSLINRFMMSSDPIPVRYWASFDETRDKTLDEIRAMNIGCFCVLKPEKRQESMILLFQIHEKVTGKPYLATIVENWMKPQRIGMDDHGNYISVPTCEEGWQFGDLNADGIVNMEDFAIYAGN